MIQRVSKTQEEKEAIYQAVLEQFKSQRQQEFASITEAAAYCKAQGNRRVLNWHAVDAALGLPHQTKSFSQHYMKEVIVPSFAELPWPSHILSNVEAQVRELCSKKRSDLRSAYPETQKRARRQIIEEIAEQLEEEFEKYSQKRLEDRVRKQINEVIQSYRRPAEQSNPISVSAPVLEFQFEDQLEPENEAELGF